MCLASFSWFIILLNNFFLNFLLFILFIQALSFVMSGPSCLLSFLLTLIKKITKPKIYKETDKEIKGKKEKLNMESFTFLLFFFLKFLVSSFIKFLFFFHVISNLFFFYNADVLFFIH